MAILGVKIFSTQNIFGGHLSHMETQLHAKNNKTQYDWFPGKSQNSKKFSAKFKQNPITSKIIGRFLTFRGVKIPPDGHNKF